MTSCGTSPMPGPGRSKARRSPVRGRSPHSHCFPARTASLRRSRASRTPPRVQRSRTSPVVASTRSRGTSRPSPCRCFGSTTRWVTARATGSTTTRLTSPQTPSVQLASAPIVNCVVSAMATFLVSWTLRCQHRPAPAGVGRCLRLKSQPAGWVRDLQGHYRLASREVSDRADGGRTRDRLVPGSRIQRDGETSETPVSRERTLA